MKLSALLALLLLVSLAGNVYLAVLAPSASGGTIPGLEQEAAALRQENEELKTRVAQDEQALRSYAAQVEAYREQVHLLEAAAQCGGPGLSGSAYLEAPAVVSAGDGGLSQQMTGDMVTVAIEIVPGKGRVLVETTPLMGVIFQDAANTAVYVAQQETDTSLSQSDVIFTIAGEEEIPAVDGPSAGALMTLITIAAITNQTLPQDLTLTGTIDEAGQVGRIGGVFPKAEAAKEAGKTLIILPRANARTEIAVTETRQAGGITIVEEHAETVDTAAYLGEEVGIEVAFVDDIGDVTAIAFGNET